MVFFILACFAYVVALIIAMWKIFEKAGQPGWAAIIPIYNSYILLKIVGKPAWWLILLCIPYVNTIFFIWVYNILSKSFGKNEMTTFLMALFGIGIFQLGFGEAQYEGPYGDQAAFQTYRDKEIFDFEHAAV